MPFQAKRPFQVAFSGFLLRSSPVTSREASDAAFEGPETSVLVIVSREVVAAA